MRRNAETWLLATSFIVIVLFYIVSVRAAVPPYTLSNTTYLDGIVAPDGINVSVSADCYGSGVEEVDSYLTNFGFGYYTLEIPMDDTVTTPSVDEGCVSGQTLYITVDGLQIVSPSYGSMTVGSPGESVQQDIYAEYSFNLDLPSNGTTTANTTPYFNWTDGTIGNVTWEILIESTPTFSAPYVFNTSGLTNLSYQLGAGDALSDGTYYWTVRGYQNGALNDTASYNYFTIDTTPSAISLVTPANNTWTATASQTLSVTTNEAGYCRFDTSSAVAFDSKSVLMSGSGTSHTYAITLPSQGANNYYIQCNDSLGNVMNISDEYHERLNLDSQAPTPASAVVQIDGGAHNSTDTTVEINWSGFVDQSCPSCTGVQGYYYNTINNEGTSSGTSTSAAAINYSSASQGTFTIYVWAVDNLSNIGNSASDTIIVDSIAPSIGTWSHSPSDFNNTYTGTLNITVSVSDAVIGLNDTPQGRYRRGNSESYSSYSDLTLVSGSTYLMQVPELAAGWDSIVNENVTVQVYASDRLGNSDTGNYSVEVIRENAAPVMDSISDQTAYEDLQLSFVVSATDIDGDSLTFTTNMTELTVTSLNTTAANVTWTPSQSDVGTHTAYFTVSDATAQDNSSTVTITVNNVNDAPVLTAINDQSAYLGESFQMEATATDADTSDTLSYYDDTDLFDINSSTGIANFTPILSHVGAHNITINVTDSTDWDEDNFTLTVYYCGDDVCNSNEDCSVCEADCGSCDDTDVEQMTIAVEPRNCLGENMQIAVYQLYQRATCDHEGYIVDGYEICGNLTGVSLTVSIYQGEEWNDTAEYVTDENGKISFIPLTAGEYRFLGKKSSFPDTYEYAEVDVCITEEQESLNQSINKTEPIVEEETEPEDETEPQEEEPAVITEEESSIMLFIIFYLLVPILMISMIAVTTWWYQKEKDNNKFLLETRIKAFRIYKYVSAYIKYYYDQMSARFRR